MKRRSALLLLAGWLLGLATFWGALEVTGGQYIYRLGYATGRAEATQAANELFERGWEPYHISDNQLIIFRRARFLFLP